MVRLYRVAYLNERYLIVDETFVLSRVDAVRIASQACERAKRSRRLPRWKRVAVTEIDVSLFDTPAFRPVVSLDLA